MQHQMVGWYCIKIGKDVEKASLLSRFEPGICRIQVTDADHVMSRFCRNCGTKKVNYMEQIHSPDPTSHKNSKKSPLLQVLWIQISQLRDSVLNHTNSVHILTLYLFFPHLSLLSLQQLSVSSEFLVQLLHPNCHLVRIASSRQTSHLILLYLTTTVSFLGIYICSTASVV